MQYAKLKRVSEMHCSEVTRNLPDHVRGVPGRHDANAVDAHLAHCAACTREHARLTMFFRQMAAERPPIDAALGAIILAGVNQRIDAQVRHGRTPVRAWRTGWLPQRGVRLGLTLAAVAVAVIVGIHPVDQASTDRQLHKELYGAVSVLDTLQMEELERSMLLDVRSLDALTEQVAHSLDSVQVDTRYLQEVFGDLSSEEILEAGSEYLAAHDVLSTFDETSLATFDEQ